MFVSWYQKFSSQPHQPFFTSGILFLVLFISLFLCVYSNTLLVDTSILTYHAYSMIFVVFIQFFLGFLFVVFPRFLMQPEIEKKVFMKQFVLYFFITFGFLISILFYSEMIFIFQILLFITQIMSFRLLYSIHKKSLIKIKDDTKWILIAFLFGLFFHFLFIFSNINFEYSYVLSKIAINGGFYLFIFMIIFTISQRMIPFFTTVKDVNYKVNKSKNLLFLVFSFLSLKVILLVFNNPKINLISDIALFIIITNELIKWKLPIFKVPAIMWILYLGLYWIPIAFFISIIEGLLAFYDPTIIFEKAVIHTLSLGYFVTVLIGFGTRVILGHSGNIIHANNFAIFIFIFLQMVVILRIFTSFSLNFEINYLFLLNLTGFLLIFTLVLWSFKYLAILLKGK